MAIADNSALIQQVKELAAAVSTQAQVTNRIWIGLVTVAVISLLPQVLDNQGKLPVPLGFGTVPANWFYLILSALLTVLSIAFSSAHAQQVRAQKLAQAYVDSLPSETELYGMHPRELFDMLRLPSLNRVAPLAQSLRGKYQFYSGKASCPTYLRILSAIYYALLKLVSMGVYFGLPIYALLQTYNKTQVPSLLQQYAIFAGATVAVATLVQVFITDLLYSVKVSRKL